MTSDTHNTERFSAHGDILGALPVGAAYHEAVAEAVIDRRYVLKREIARGGMGCVFEAQHVVTRARVALKVLRKPALDLADAQERLLREARILGSLRHEMLVAVYDAGVCAKHGPYITLELIDGRPLHGILLSRQTLPVAQTVALGVQLCEALSTVHQAGVVHRDVKPSNVLVTHTAMGDHVELIDFGIAKILGEPDVKSHAEPKLTRVGEVLGTIEHMSPEQLLGRASVDLRTDIYAVGVLLYECLSGEVPLGGSPPVVMSNMIAGTLPRSLRERRQDVSEALEQVVFTALALDPDKRFASARALSTALVAAAGGSVASLDLLGFGTPERPVTLAGPTPRAPDSGAQRRQYARALYVTPVRIVLGPGKVHDGRTEDISEGGLLIVTQEECAGDQQVQVRLPLPTSGRVVTVEGITRWVKTRKDQRALGVEFTNVGADARVEIARYVEIMGRS